MDGFERASNPLIAQGSEPSEEPRKRKYCKRAKPGALSPSVRHLRILRCLAFTSGILSACAGAPKSEPKTAPAPEKTAAPETAESGADAAGSKERVAKLERALDESDGIKQCFEAAKVETATVDVLMAFDGDGKLASTHIGKSTLKEDENFANCISAVVQSTADGLESIPVSNVQHTLHYKH